MRWKNKSSTVSVPNQGKIWKTSTYASETTMKSSQFQASRRYVNSVNRKPRAKTFTMPSIV